MAKRVWRINDPDRCVHKKRHVIRETLQGVNIQCERAAAAGSAYCWQHQED